MSSPPAWSMGTSQRNIDLGSIKNQIPGPGTYDSSPTNRSKLPSWKVGTSPRGLEFSTSAIPGPGTYNVAQNFAKDAPKIHFGQRFRKISSINTPGPGAYEVNAAAIVERKLPSYSIRGRNNLSFDNKTDAPGPGAYDQSSKILNTTVPNIKIGTSKRDENYDPSKTPGPGAYEPKELKPSGQKFKFGTTVRDNIFKFQEFSKTLPGPGAYEVRSKSEVKGGGTTILPKRPDDSLSEISKFPGPGQYDPKPIERMTLPVYKMNKSPRREEKKPTHFVPGPGQYDPKLVNEKGPSIKIGSSHRGSSSDINSTPGPGNYEISSKIIEGPKYRMGSRKEDKSLKYTSTIPGPGAYSPQLGLVKEKSPKHKIGSGARTEYNEGSRIPGPGQYEIKNNLRGPKWGFGSEKRGNAKILNKEFPGPGAYDIPSKLADVPKYVFGNSSPKTSHSQQQRLLFFSKERLNKPIGWAILSSTAKIGL